MNTNGTKSGLLAALGLALVAGCANQPTPHLLEARQQYDEAYRGVANEYAPGEVHQAKVALEEAERAHARKPGSEKEKHLAYIAHRKAMLAQETAGARMATSEREKAESEAEQILLSQRDQSRGALAETEESLEDTQQRLTAEQEARSAAEKTAAAAMESLNEIASVHAEQEKVVITLSGEVLFGFNKAELLPIARQRLATVAKVLKENADGKKIVIEGHTDSRGSSNYNDELSRKRAEAVKSYLVSEGVPEDMLDTVGKGEQDPIASNDTPEGRANNRRVEIEIDASETVTSRRGDEGETAPTRTSRR
jgi:outer membrane protein OmpA-like peptidoglycan-associated protein